MIGNQSLMFAGISVMIVNPEYQGYGLGTRFFGAIKIAHKKHMICQGIVLANDNQYPFWKKLGFRYMALKSPTGIPLEVDALPSTRNGIEQLELGNIRPLILRFYRTK